MKGTTRTGTRRPGLLALAVALILSGAGTLVFAATASAAATLVVTPNTNLAGGQTVNISGSGLAASSTGSVLECNNDASQPTVSLPAPISQDVPVSCSGIAITALLTTGSDGSLTGTFTVISPTPGPPCGGSYLVACPATDSAGNDPATDAALYPCPPTAAQQSAGVTCTLAFGDQAGDQVTANISFSSGGGGTTTTTSSTTTTTSSTTTTTTTKPTTTTTTVPCDAKSVTSSGSPSLTADPGTCLNGGTVVKVTGSGFDPKAAGAVLECNDSKSQPTVALPAPFSTDVPVSCSGVAASALVTTSDTGTLSTTFTVGAGTIGPPCGDGYLISTCPTTDSAGNDPATDAAKYPCPPTDAQAKAGASCVLAFGDSGGKQATVNIKFVPKPTPKPVTQPTGTSATQASSSSATGASGTSAASTTATTAPASTSNGQLAFTGPGPGIWVLLVGGIVLLDLGFLVLTIYYRPRELFAMAGRRVNRIFGGRS